MQDIRQSVTIKQVAERAGVSLMTVSRVLNDKGVVKEATRDKVQQAIRDLKYRPNISARRLAGGQSLFIGLLYVNPSGGYLSKILAGSLEACRVNRHHLVLQDFGAHAPYDKPENMVQALKAAGLDGVVVTPPLSNNLPLTRAIKASGLAMAKVAPDDIFEAGPHVAIDDRAAARDMLEFIASKGHTRIGFVKGPDSHPSTHHRYEGFLQGMEIRGLKPNADYVRQGDFTYKSGLDAGRQLLSLPNPPTAIFAANDDMAGGIVTAAHTLGVSVPAQVSVVGFDDTELATNMWPELTTVRQPIAEMASRAVTLIAATIRGDHETIAANRGLLNYDIIERDTVSDLSKTTDS